MTIKHLSGSLRAGRDLQNAEERSRRYYLLYHRRCRIKKGNNFISLFPEALTSKGILKYFNPVVQAVIHVNTHEDKRVNSCNVILPFFLFIYLFNIPTLVKKNPVMDWWPVQSLPPLLLTSDDVRWLNSTFSWLRFSGSKFTSCFIRRASWVGEAAETLDGSVVRADSPNPDAPVLLQQLLGQLPASDLWLHVFTRCLSALVSCLYSTSTDQYNL